MAARKFKYKVLFNPKIDNLEGVGIWDRDNGTLLCNAVGVAVPDSKGYYGFPKTYLAKNPHLVECEAEMTVHVPEPKQKGEVTLKKKVK